MFFAMLRRNTIEGVFCDPMHGGNVDMIGWQMIGFPGPHWSYFLDVDKHFNAPFRPKPVNLHEELQAMGFERRPAVGGK